MPDRRSLWDRLRSRYAIKLFGISAVIVIVIMSIGTVMALQVSDRVTQNQLESIEGSAELEANALARWFEGEQKAIRLLSTHQGIQPDDPNTTRETLNAEVTESSNALAALHVVERASTPTSNGTTEQVVVSTDPTLEGRQLRATNINWGEDTDENERNFTFESRDDIMLSWVYVDGNESLVAIATPTADGDHVLIGEYRPSVRVQESVEVGNGTETVVLGGVSGWVIFDDQDTAEFRRYKGQVNSTEVGARILARENAYSILSGAELDETEVRGYHSVPADGVDWVVVKETPRSTALALTDEVRRDLGILIGSMIVGFMLIGILIQRGPIQSIKRHAEQANAIASGDLDVQIEETDRIDEVGQLRRSFANTKAYIETIARQSQALSRQEFDAPVLEETIPGRVGEAMVTMRQDLERAIAELEAERERYSRLVEQSNDGIVVVQDGRYVFANDRFVEITGYDRDQLFEMTVEKLIAPEDRELARQQYDQRMTDGGSMETYELGIATKRGEQRTVEISAARITHDGEPAALVNVRDITDRKRRERRLDIFNRVLRHNLRNNLQPVKAALTSLDASPQSSVVQSATTELDDLFETARTARRIEQAFENLEIHQHDLGAILRDIESRASREYPDATLSVTTATATVEAAHVLNDALWELVENACEHTGPEPHVEITLERRAATVVVRITDDGDGLPETERTALESGGETNLEHSSGLGLWYAHWTVEASGGDLSFRTTPGTTVSVTLPLAADQTDS